MKFAVSAGLLLAFSISGFAQGHRGGFRNPHPISPGVQTRNFNNGFGRVIAPGTGVPAGRNTVTFPFATKPTTFVERIGTSVSGAGFHGGHGRRHGFGGGRGFGGFPIAYPVPVYVGDEYYGEPPYYQEQQTPNITIVMPQQATPPVTVNQYAPDSTKPAEGSPSGGAVREYQAPAPERPETSDNQVMFFIALKDSSVYTALAYWVEDSTLHYITSQGKHNQVSLDLVDRDTSAKLNEGRRVEFLLPPSR